MWESSFFISSDQSLDRFRQKISEVQSTFKIRNVFMAQDQILAVGSQENSLLNFVGPVNWKKLWKGVRGRSLHYCSESPKFKSH